MIELRANHLTKKYAGVKALDDVSLVFSSGRITGLVGPNGSGKSTLINALTGVTPFDNGSIIIDRLSLSRVRPFDVFTYGLARTFQEVRLFNQMAVWDNMMLALTERGVFASMFEAHKKWHEVRAEEILKEVELLEKRNEYAGNLSYGQRKLLETARALAIGAEMIFFDEPFAGLSPHMVHVVKKILLRLREEEKAIILVEHNLGLIRELCERVVVLDSGVVIADGAPDKVFAEQRVIDAYIGK